MVLQAIYVVRHGYRSNWSVDPSTGQYESSVPSPTGIVSDPALASYGVKQAQQLGQHLQTLEPPVDLIYSSPFYRCLQTLHPFVTALASPPSTSPSSPQSTPKVRVNVEPGLGEFYGLARFDHPSPAPMTELHRHFAYLHAGDHPVIVPSTKGEGITQLHDRVAYCLDRLIRQADADPAGPRTLLICTHAAVMIAIGRALTGRMPESESEDDFRCFTCSFSKFARREGGSQGEGKEVRDWVAERPDDVPDVRWRGGKGVAGGWECEVNGDCSFLDGGEERGCGTAVGASPLRHSRLGNDDDRKVTHYRVAAYTGRDRRFSGDESFLKDPNAFNDANNQKSDAANLQAHDGEQSKGSRL